MQHAGTLAGIHDPGKTESIRVAVTNKRGTVKVAVQAELLPMVQLVRVARP